MDTTKIVRSNYEGKEFLLSDPTCCRCDGHATARTVCMPATGIDGAYTPLVGIYMDRPSKEEDVRRKPFVSEGAQLITWMLQRMGIHLATVYFDYVLKCHVPKIPGKKADRTAMLHACKPYRMATLEYFKPKAIVALGEVAAETFTGRCYVGTMVGSDVDCYEAETREICPKVWVGYSPAYVLESPGEAHVLYGILWHACKEAGMQPKTDLTKSPFKWGFK